MPSKKWSGGGYSLHFLEVENKLAMALLLRFPDVFSVGCALYASQLLALVIVSVRALHAVAYARARGIIVFV